MNDPGQGRTIKVGEPLPRHPLFADEAQARAWWRASYRVDHTYGSPGTRDASGNAVLYRHEAEEDASYKRRCATLKAHKIAGPIIAKYNQMAFRRAPVRMDMDEGAKSLVDDCTGNSTGLDRFLSRALLMAQVEACAYILVSSASESEEAEEMTAAQAESLGAGPMLTLIRADSVVDWCNDDQGHIESATVIYRNDNARYAIVFTEQNRQRIDLNDAGIVTAIYDETPHGFNGIPVVRLEPLQDSDIEPPGANPGTDSTGTQCGVRQSQIAGMAESQQAIANTLSLIRDHCAKTNFALMVMTGVNAAEMMPAAGTGSGTSGSPKIQVGSSHALCLPNPGAKIELVGGKAEVSDGLFQTFALDLDNLYRTAGLDTASAGASKQVTSGAAQDAKANGGVVPIVTALVRSVSHAESEIWDLIGGVDGWSVAKPSVAYALDFDAGDFSADLADVVKSAAITATPPWLRRMTFQRFAQRHLTMTPELQTEIDQSAEAPSDPFAQTTEDTPPAPGGTRTQAQPAVDTAGA